MIFSFFFFVFFFFKFGVLVFLGARKFFFSLTEQESIFAYSPSEIKIIKPKTKILGKPQAGSIRRGVGRNRCAVGYIYLPSSQDAGRRGGELGSPSKKGVHPFVCIETMIKAVERFMGF